ncbi:hypothetical protein BN7_2199 [Wickerhamomyces ciferrii]|uniref:Genetic interactor of prohibitin 7, mitochondrial n=1 Tax=Wickerhamomyces ciferrii (strain ATCC 14091 / BCRC 22168 / CBS 111 / JCM 3599 / NBRC 0793 / NRRL Y-1031 F-60-10) TaxID=1206466 RepID=K0KC49_WICCF|nr:uncharacterized protein BN7_2199 [Wickerhamomyces ciferrii]CCH42655.1 hypothetical protein BN7_2199 [Wickerhamomyces ciferrii]
MLRLRNLTLQGTRLYSTIPKPEIPKTQQEANPTSTPTSTKPLSQREQITNRQRIELAQNGIKDIFEGFLTSEESYDPIDTKPIMANPPLYINLSEFQRQQVREELDKRSRQNWNKLTSDMKKMSYFHSYGNYGPREDLSNNWNKLIAPEDLPFKIPSISKIAKLPSEKIHKLDEVDLEQVSPKRIENWNKMTRRLDPFTKSIVYIAALVSLYALYNDKMMEKEGKIPDYEELENIPESSLVLIDLKREQELADLKTKQEQSEVKNQNKKWYYLWLK